jgi:hypothetical protein
MKPFKVRLCSACGGTRLDADGHSPCANCKGKGFVIPNKFRAIKQRIEGIAFDSKGEAQRYSELRLMVKAKLISGLEVKPVYEIKVNGFLICKYIPDFRYKFPSGKFVVEDFKGMKTKTYRLKKKLMKAVHGIDIQESKKKG